MQDRTYYRAMPDGYLIDEGICSQHELCIVLAERLEDAITLEQTVADQRETIDDMRLLIMNLEDETAALLKQIGEGQSQ